MIYLAAVPLLIGLTLALFITDQRLRQANELHGIAKALLLPWLWIGLGLDVLLNAVIGSIAFLEIPREWTFSRRINRHEHQGSGWRRQLATWVCEGFLRQVDSDHC